MIYLVALGLYCCIWAFSSCDKWGLLFLETLRLLFAMASLVVHTLSCFEACGIFLDQGSNLSPLHWQLVSHPLYHQGSLSSGLIGFINRSHPEMDAKNEGMNT